MNTIPQPSIQSLVLSCVFSIVLAFILLIIAVLPAEYNIDPTGLGKQLGLTVLSNTTSSTAAPAAIVCPDLPTNTHDHWKDTVSIIIPAQKGLEYKFYVREKESFEFIWQTADDSQLFFDFHGEPEGDKTGYFKSFKKTTDSQSSGTLSPPFTGSHGWYWKNNNNHPVTIRLKTRGNYKILGLR